MNTHEAMCWLIGAKMSDEQLKARLEELSKASLSKPMHIVAPWELSEYITLMKLWTKRHDWKIQGLFFASEITENEVLPLKGGVYDFVYQGSRPMIEFCMLHSKLTKEASEKIMEVVRS